MTQQKSENCERAQGRRKPVPTQEGGGPGGAKAVPVERMTQQLGLDFGTAEQEAQAPGDGARVGRLRPSQALALPLPKDKEEKAAPATLQEVSKRLEQAFKAVAANRGAPGPDRQSIEQVREHLSELIARLSQALLEGIYKPGNIRRVWIPKAGGGQRGLGIPDVVDRMVQEAVRQVLEPLYEPSFHPNSHGFRPARSCHTAIVQAREYLEDGKQWVVDIDLENFFNRVNHQRLMARLAMRVQDKELLRLIGKMLKAKIVMPDGVVIGNDEGVPQGGPLSPLLSNVVLDELDRELQKRGHRFVRYADDANIYVGSERAGRRVMASVASFIERRLRLKVNEAKSAVAEPQGRHFLGFSLRRKPSSQGVEVGMSKRTKDRIGGKIRDLTRRNWGNTLQACITRINAYLTGWIGFFGICTKEVESTLRHLDAHIRRRLRAIELRQYKRKLTIARKLIARGVRAKTAWSRVYEERKSLWAMSHMPVVEKALPNSLWEQRGLKSLEQLYWAHPARGVASVPLSARG